MSEVDKIKQRYQKAIVIGDQLREMVRTSGYQDGYKKWLEKSIEVIKNELADSYAKLSDKEYGVLIGRLIGFRDILAYPEIQMNKADEASKKLGELNGK